MLQSDDAGEAVREANKVLAAEAARQAAEAGKQSDLEGSGAAGVAPAQRAKIAEAEGIVADRLRSHVERIERLEEEKAEVAESISGVYASAKGEGFDVKTLRQIIRLRKQEPAEVEQAETLLDLYRQALGM